jgi:hypothetical protein
MTRVLHIPFYWPFAIGDEIDYSRAAIATPKFSGDGSYTAHCHTQTFPSACNAFSSTLR